MNDICFSFLTRPSSKTSLLKIDGIAAARADKFGLRFVEAVREYCQENNLNMDNFPATAPSHIAESQVMSCISACAFVLFVPVYERGVPSQEIYGSLGLNCF